MNGADSANGQAISDTPPPGAETLPRRRRPDLATLVDVRREMGRVYRDMKLKKTPTQDGTRLVYVLQAIAKIIEGSELQQRLEALERAMQKKGQH